MSLVPSAFGSSSASQPPGLAAAGSVVIQEAHVIIRDMRDHALRALNEAARYQKESAALNHHEQVLLRDIEERNAEIVALEQDCLRQEVLLAKFPERLENAMKASERLLESWTSLDRNVAEFRETEKLVDSENQGRNAMIASTMIHVNKELARYHVLHNLEMQRHNIRLEDETKRNHRSETEIARLRNEIAVAEDNQKSAKERLAQLNINELTCVERLRQAHDDADNERKQVVAHPSIDELRAQLEHLQLVEGESQNHTLALEERQINVKHLEKRLEDARAALALAQSSLNDISSMADKENLQALENKTRLESQLLIVQEEITRQESERTMVLEKVEAKAKAMRAELSSRLHTEQVVLENEKSHLQEDLERLKDRMHTERLNWERKIAEKKRDAIQQKKIYEAQQKLISAKASSTMALQETAEEETIKNKPEKRMKPLSKRTPAPEPPLPVRKAQKIHKMLPIGSTSDDSSSQSQSVLSQLVTPLVKVFTSKGDKPNKVDTVTAAPSQKPKTFAKSRPLMPTSTSSPVIKKRPDALLVRTPDWVNSQGIQRLTQPKSSAVPRKKALSLADMFDDDEIGQEERKITPEQPRRFRAFPAQPHPTMTTQKAINPRGRKPVEKFIPKPIAQARRANPSNNDVEDQSSGSQFDLFN